MFYKLWHDAEKGKNEYVTTEVHWSEVPGRDADWKEQTIRNTSEEQFNQEFECEFLGSVNTLITSSKLKTLVYDDPLKSNQGLDVYEELNLIILMYVQLTLLVVLLKTTQLLYY